ncbi:hypothetical protein [Geminisphaera colitermitum]|uniref:hypothetical protein n=1 Tax=Geminisphaera colitermitum TaxID=1148786 RepID=UPI000196515B|nr:hypothetical protein [Geminisphaera colitermitum]
MFRRLVLENWISLLTVIAFITALSIYLPITWRALRMTREKTDHLAHLPLNDD